MPIYRGSTKVEVGQLKIGDQDVKEVYLGAIKIWPEVTNSGLTDGQSAATSKSGDHNGSSSKTGSDCP